MSGTGSPDSDRLDRLFALVLEVHTNAASTRATVEAHAAAMRSEIERNAADHSRLIADHDKLSTRVAELERRQWQWAGAIAALATFLPIILQRLKTLF